VVGFNGYEVSNLGRVRSWLSLNGRGVAKKPHLLKPLPVRAYFQVGMRRDGEYTYRKIHHLVLEAFVGPCPAGMEGCHGDDDPSNNAVENLRWDTPKRNAEERVARGRQTKGSASPRAILSEAQVAEIKRMLRETPRHGLSRELARKYGVRDSAINSIKTGKTW